MQQSREEVSNKAQVIHENIKKVFDRITKVDDFTFGDKVLTWDSRIEDKRKHGKFDNLWFGPLAIVEVKGNNTFVLQNLEGLYSTYLVNGRFLKHYI